jgi:hypothetical protein
MLMLKFFVENWRIAALTAVGAVLTAAPAMAGDIVVRPIPEPGTLALMAGGAAAIFILRRRRK